MSADVPVNFKLDEDDRQEKRTQCTLRSSAPRLQRDRGACDKDETAGVGAKKLRPVIARRHERIGPIRAAGFQDAEHY